MKRFFCLSVLILSIIAHPQEINIIPKPVSLKVGKGEFILDKNTSILAYEAQPIQIATVFNEFLKNYYGFTIPITKTATTKEKTIFFPKKILTTNNRNYTGAWGWLISLFCNG